LSAPMPTVALPVFGIGADKAERHGLDYLHEISQDFFLVAQP